MSIFNGFVSGVQYVIGLGAAVFLPIIIFTLGLVVGLKPGKALRSALTIGVAFTGMNLVIGALFYADIAPAATAMVERMGLTLDMVDIGWTPAAAIAFAWPWAAFFILVQVGVNLIVLALGWTKTLNIDMWNTWVKAYIGALAVGLTGNLAIGVALAVIMVVYELKFADWTTYMVQDYIDVPGVNVTHSTVFGLLVGTPINALLDRIPWINKVQADPKALQKKFGVFGESIILGMIIGLLFGILAGYDLPKILSLGVAAATALVLLPMIAKLFMEALAPLSESLGNYMKKRFPEREIYIGLDWPILAGNPATYTVGILAIPIIILLSVILPGNRVLVFGSIADWAWMVSIIGVLAGGNIIRMLIISTVAAIPAYLYSATYVGPLVTKVAQEVAFEMPPDASVVTWFGSSPINLFLLKIVEFNVMSIVWLVVLAGLTWFSWKYLTKQNELAKKRVAEKFGEAVVQGVKE